MNKEKNKLFFLTLSVILFFLLNGCIAVSYTNDFSGPLDVSFSLTIDTESDNPQSSQLMDISFMIVDFANATSINNTEVWVSIYSYPTEYFSNRVILGNFTLLENTTTVNSGYNYFSSWGEVSFRLQVRYIYSNSTYTSDVLSTEWITYMTFHTSTIPLPTNPNSNPSSGVGRIVGYVILCVFSLIGSVAGYSSRKSKKRSSSETGVEPQLKKESKEELKFKTELPPTSTYCSYCGNKADTGVKTCTLCGKTLEQT